MIRQELGKVGDPYLVRYVLDFGLFSIRLHHWRHSDDLRHKHDHAWNFLIFILYGSYLDISDSGEEYCHFGMVKYRKATHQHSVKLISKNCWTLLLCSKEFRKWGFYVNGKFRKRNKYFYEYGPHQD